MRGKAARQAVTNVERMSNDEARMNGPAAVHSGFLLRAFFVH